MKKNLIFKVYIYIFMQQEFYYKNINQELGIGSVTGPRSDISSQDSNLANTKLIINDKFIN